ncbi:MAG: methyltransferase domain-containing protein, partial [Clostridia bacterium]|nr:methyltransferase domain-containing protein [Clostridia bacterium]
MYNNILEITKGGGNVHLLENIDALACPLCGERLEFCGMSLTCRGARRHNFDIAKSGYVNFNTHSSTSGDDKEMAKARQTFLRRGYYERLADAIEEECGCGELICDAGCGEGYYTERAAQGFSTALGVDLSKHALTLAAKSARQNGFAGKILYTAASVYEIPLADNSCDSVINVFAPCVEEEYRRILKKG